jgi:transcriptional regulator with XRE-family HTH domain
LEAKGWKVGSAREFLQLTDEESAYIELKVRLAESLRERRQRHRLSQVDLARMLKSSQSRVAKMEAGDPSVSLDLLVRSLLTLGTSNRELSRIISTSRSAPAA